jgi:hypothetical protein
MEPCDNFAVKILHYLDDGFERDELREFRIHVVSCAKCRARLRAERALSKLLGQPRPLYRAPEAFRAHVASAVNQKNWRHSELLLLAQTSASRKSLEVASL